MQSFEEYRKEFLEDVRASAEAEYSDTVSSFVKLCALKLYEGDVLPEYTPCFHMSNYGYKRAALRVDGYAYDETDSVFYLLVAAYSGAKECETLQGAKAQEPLKKCRAFAENAIEHDLADKIEISTDAYDLASYIQDQAKYISKFVVILLTDMALSDKAKVTDEQSGKRKTKRATKNILSAEPIMGIEVEYRIWDMPRFHRIFAAGDGHEEIEIDFLDYSPKGIPCLSANTGNIAQDCQSYLCTVPGNVIADLYDDYGSRILEGNVRLFLGRKGVNKQIQNTILNEPEKFFIYNNGLSATAIEAHVQNGHLTYARDLQIVNGGQTTASLAVARKKDGADLSNIFVLMKLTQVPPETAAEIVPLISRSANSQSKVNTADFFSTHEYHIRLEQISRRKFAPAKDGAQHETHWFYERARGQYTQATSVLTKQTEIKKFTTQNPKDQVITKTHLAKVLSAWDGYPHTVSKGAETNFVEFAKRTEAQWEKQKDDFNDNYFQDAVSLVILYRDVDALIPKQSWYEKGYKANIVAYSVAYLRYFIEKKYRGRTLDLQKIWLKQKCSDILLKQMAEIAEAVYEAITDSDRPIENVTQWCKQTACWENVKRIEVYPVDDFESVLSGNEERAAIKKAARELRKTDNTVDWQTTVLELGEEYWKQLEAWVKPRKIATDAELRALKPATKISLGYFPDDRQAKSILRLREKAVNMGFQEKLKK